MIETTKYAVRYCPFSSLWKHSEQINLNIALVKFNIALAGISVLMDCLSVLFGIEKITAVFGNIEILPKPSP